MKHSRLFVFLLAFVFVMAGGIYLQAEEMVVCPVSGKEIKKAEAKVSHEYEGKTYYFCCEICKKTFIENPEKYTHKEDVVICPVGGEVMKKSEATVRATGTGHRNGRHSPTTCPTPAQRPPHHW